MRRSRSQTAETRESIVSTASKLFLEQGLAAVGMRGVMEAAGLTQGGFYRHFPSKEQLVEEANRGAFDRLFAMFERELEGKSAAEGLERVVALYLAQSRENKRGQVCPLSMLGAEFTHAGAEVRVVAASGHGRLVRLIAGCLTHLPRRVAESKASGIVSTLVGAVTLANIVPAPAARKAILQNAREAIRAQVL